MNDVRTLALCHAANDAGQDLLDSWVRPLCTRYGLRLSVAPPTATRRWGDAAQQSTVVVWDLSVDDAENVYRALVGSAKRNERNVLLSRTPLPRNVVGQSQCAPLHGHSVENAVLGEWLDRHLHDAVRGRAGSEPARPGLAAHYWNRQQPDDYFLSFRGTQQRAADRWRHWYEAATGSSVRMVARGEYSYPTEVVSQQQLWEGAARLMREMRAIGRAIIYPSADYFASFWTSTELLLLLWLSGHDRKAPRPGIADVFVAVSPDTPDLRSFADGVRDMGLPMLTPETSDRLGYLINHADPVTEAPEALTEPRGLGRLLAYAVRGRYGSDRPEFRTTEHWHRLRVPCPRCKPSGRLGHQVDWAAHMELPAATDDVDYFGYFSIDASNLTTGAVRCPGCGGRLRLVNRRGARTLWQPITSTEKDQDRPVIRRMPIWEVI